ncbi:sperm-tail PG-rich repeat-containing protein 2 [Rhinatrema bivittatum]|uniref:sperm-tail PG-rich repeat-containing protein 2 n=1 Tax=Rhinatrema bivittatum TaxID=194408 RepID=UPI00112EE286|nr:sperm-tail PG-rich repeat-containing protein 2 [Rhinatrema bivittatum]XP_029453349.1 sperm-tail PG-rich repeat-containing protein 2 [Rhinatrema bivittatum]
MYDRAPRALSVPLGCTEASVGPGSYEVWADSIKLRPDGYAPFLSKVNRKIEFDGQSIAVPGPGHYDITKVQDTVKGGQSLQNKEKRFTEFQSANPGPGSYNLFHGRALNMMIGSYREPASKQLNPHQLKLFRQIEYKRKSEAPSIPSPGQAYGYDENEDGTLIKQLPPSRDNTLGPAYYRLLFNEADSTSKYKGVHFGNRTEKRAESRKYEGPGPGEYEINQKTAVYYENVNIKKDDSKKNLLFVPRYHDVVILQEEKKGVPGPGKYEIKSQFEKRRNVKSSVDIPQVPFLSRSKRFQRLTSNTPAPGTYNERRTDFQRSWNTTGRKQKSFGQTAVRFVPESRQPKTPGPGSYNILNYCVAEESLKKADQGNKCKGAFGSSTVRDFPVSKGETAGTPGPSHYQVTNKIEETYKRQKTSVFASGTGRLSEPKVGKDAPPPGSYDVQGSFKKSYGKREYMPPRTGLAKRKHGSFLSAVPRDFLFNAETYVPGPGTYSPLVKPAHNISVSVSKEERFKHPQEMTPGPAAYEISSVFKDSVLKGTFNVTLPNPLLSIKENSMPRKDQPAPQPSA